MAEITFTSDEKDVLANKIKSYFLKELDTEIGQFEALFLLDFFTKEIGGYYYNRGLYDAQAALENRLETISEAIYELEKPTDAR